MLYLSPGTQLEALSGKFPKAVSLSLIGFRKLGPTLPLGISRFSDLKEWSIRECPKLVALPWTLGLMTSLIMLEVDGQSLPDTLGDLCNLKKLSLDYDSPLPESFGRLLKLETLLLGNGEMQALPESLGNLTMLKVIVCEDYLELRSFPNSLSKLTNLVKMDLYGCDSLELSESVGGLVSLKKLYFGKSDRPSKASYKFPDKLCDLVNLKELSLSASVIVVPERLGDLYNLEELSLCNNPFAALPESLGQLRNLRKLEVLFCNDLSTVPESLGQLSSLEDLDLSDNSALKTLPESLGQLSKLKHLSLNECCSLTALPESLGLLSNLQYLNLARCTVMSALPERFSGLGALSFLDVSKCESLDELPLAIWMLGLKYLGVAGCKLSVGDCMLNAA